MKLRVETEIRPTEDREKVEAAVRRIFPTLELKQEEDSIVGESTDVSSLAKLHQLLRQQMILDSTRSVMLARKRGETMQFMLNKQVASVSKVSFTSGESPLGPIIVTLEASDLDRLIDYLAPRTQEGRPIREIIY